MTDFYITEAFSNRDNGNYLRLDSIGAILKSLQPNLTD